MSELLPRKEKGQRSAQQPSAYRKSEKPIVKVADTHTVAERADSLVGSWMERAVASNTRARQFAVAAERSHSHCGLIRPRAAELQSRLRQGKVRA
jgi:hypothetical protein